MTMNRLASLNGTNGNGTHQDQVLAFPTGGDILPEIPASDHEGENMAKAAATSDMSKMDMIREAVEKFGEKKPKALAAWIKEQHGVDVDTNYISGQRKKILGDAAGSSVAKRRGRPPGSKNSTAGNSVAKRPDRPRAGSPADGTYTATEIQSVAILVKEIGAEKVQSLLELIKHVQA